MRHRQPSPAAAKEMTGVEDRFEMQAVDDAEAGRKRKRPRDSLLLSATLRYPGAPTGYSIRVRNLSEGGLMGEGETPFEGGERIEVELRNIGAVPGVVAWVESGRLGVAFDLPIDPRQARRPLAARKDDMLMRPIVYTGRPPLGRR